VFASEEEALAAAEKAYAEYLRVSDEILIDGGNDPRRLLDVATEGVYQAELDGFNQVHAQGWHSTGGSTADHFRIEQFNPRDKVDVLTAYLCSDVSRVDVLDASGASVVSPTRPNRTAFEVSFSYREGSSTGLVVSNKSPWAGGGIC
jgi:hypothetical protein